MYQVIDLVN